MLAELIGQIFAQELSLDVHTLLELEIQAQHDAFDEDLLAQVLPFKLALLASSCVRLRQSMLWR